MGSPQRQTVKAFFNSATSSITEWTLFLKEKVLKLWLPYKYTNMHDLVQILSPIPLSSRKP